MKRNNSRGAKRTRMKLIERGVKKPQDYDKRDEELLQETDDVDDYI